MRERKREGREKRERENCDLVSCELYLPMPPLPLSHGRGMELLSAAPRAAAAATTLAAIKYLLSLFFSLFN
jgi:hypothetical protein